MFTLALFAIKVLAAKYYYSSMLNDNGVWLFASTLSIKEISISRRHIKLPIYPFEAAKWAYVLFFSSNLKILKFLVELIAVIID